MENNQTVEKEEYLSAKFRLKDNDKNGEFRPFMVDYKSHPSLRTIVKAFNNTDQIKLGYTTLDKGKGLVEPTMKKKDIYITGGSLADHLKNKLVEEYDLVTDASPDEIRMILSTKDSDLKEVRPPNLDIENMSKYKNLPEMEARKRIFYASRWDANHEEMEFTVVIDSQKIFLATLNKNSKNRMLTPKKRYFTTSVEEDSFSRGLTILALYLKLKNDEGENGELIDPHGGMFDLKNGTIELIKQEENPFGKDPYLPLKIAKLASVYSGDKKIPSNILNKIKENIQNLDVKKHVVKRYYISAIEDVDVPVDQYLKNLVGSELITIIFPDMHITDPVSDMPNGKIIPTALILQNNIATKIDNVLTNFGWSKNDIENIIKLTKLAQFCKHNYLNPHLIYDFFAKPSNLPNYLIKKFMSLLGKEDLYSKIFGHDFSDVMKKYVEKEGKREVNPRLIHFLGRVPRTDEFEQVRQKLFDHEVKKLLATN